MDTKNSAGKILYSDLSEVCHSFYRMYFPHERIASSVDSILKKHNCKDIVFFGGLVYVAQILHEKGYNLTFVDYTEEMVCEAKKILDDVDFIVSDMRTFNLDEKKDAIILMGRIMTYMYTDTDVVRALSAFRDSLKSGGIVIMDNYETGIIDKGDYFNGTVELKDNKNNNHTLRRISTIKQKKDHPALYEWDCVYEDISCANKKDIIRLSDKGHILRAFTKDEIEMLVEKSGLRFIAHMQNFEKRSFITIAQKP